ncbi:uncharacterized protein LOC111869318 [Cryptotermes secundus]|uniref:uncharacterized protein LOC111869318 n=1 Tax=Cryptotermes secundus TaxID=105785 RepID=UPI000CD7BD4F|nr:uncharacterized protein LOC111869318 [Cryptotermes secundus]XP_023716530.1 uncharacterized protein LOC111869318 [Cryptotermes secundus]XP_023716540.1 uncharacterized protein LOC111869318 [Cryptotermes secundus]XP_033609290.1 uncharacterized protein LOC111869318 [Cryptotermes secundus]
MRGYVFHFLTLVGVTLATSLLLWYISTITVLYRNAGGEIFTKNQTIPVNENLFEGFNNETGTENGLYIVPNIIHFLRFKQKNFSFVDAVCVLSAFKNHRPDKIIFHTDVDKFVGPYWEKIKNTPGIVYEIRNLTVPDKIFGQKFSKNYHLWHAGDVTRIRILMEYGGIFLDNDIYVVQNLSKFRKFEMAIGWDDNQCIGTQVLVANKDARFLRLWLESYREYYPDRWYYNAGCKPTEEVLYKRPELVHRVKLLFGVHMLVHNLYKTLWKDWRKQYSVHLLMRHRSYLDKEHLDKWPVFDENNIKDYPMTFGEMARDVYGIS